MLMLILIYVSEVCPSTVLWRHLYRFVQNVYQPYYCNNLIQKLTNLFDAFRMIFNTRINAHLQNVFLKGINVKKLIMDMYFIIYSIKTEG